MRGRAGVDLWCHWGRYRVDLGSTWGRSRGVPATIRARSQVDLGSTFGRSGVAQESRRRDFCATPATPRCPCASRAPGSPAGSRTGSPLGSPPGSRGGSPDGSLGGRARGASGASPGAGRAGAAGSACARMAGGRASGGRQHMASAQPVAPSQPMASAHPVASAQPMAARQNLGVGPEVVAMLEAVVSVGSTITCEASAGRSRPRPLCSHGTPALYREVHAWGPPWQPDGPLCRDLSVLRDSSQRTVARRRAQSSLWRDATRGTNACIFSVGTSRCCVRRATASWPVPELLHAQASEHWQVVASAQLMPPARPMASAQPWCRHSQRRRSPWRGPWRCWRSPRRRRSPWQRSARGMRATCGIGAAHWVGAAHCFSAAHGIGAAHSATSTINTSGSVPHRHPAFRSNSGNSPIRNTWFDEFRAIVGRHGQAAFGELLIRVTSRAAHLPYSFSQLRS